MAELNALHLVSGNYFDILEDEDEGYLQRVII